MRRILKGIWIEIGDKARIVLLMLATIAGTQILLSYLLPLLFGWQLDETIAGIIQMVAMFAVYILYSRFN